MARTAKKILKEIRRARQYNKIMYGELEKLLPNRDLTLELVQRAYEAHPKKAKKIHRAIIHNDGIILRLSRELTECV